MKRFLPLLAVLAIAACSNSASLPNAVQQPKAVAKDDPTTVVAKVNGVSITLEEIEKPILGKLRAQEQNHLKEMFLLRSSSMEKIVAERLIDAAAEEKGVTSEELLEQEIFAKIIPVTDQEIRDFYDARRGMAGIPPFEDAAGQIRGFIENERVKEATQAFFDQLHGAAEIEILMTPPEAPRMEVEAKGPSRGPEDAPVTIVEFSDFECPFCSRANEALEQVAEAYGTKVRIVFRDFPLSFHANAQKAAEAGHCADEQGKFWPMHDKMFANQRALDVDSLKGYAKEVGLDEAAFASCLDSGEKAQVVKENLEAGLELGVQGTPAFFINGKMVSGALPFDDFKSIIDEELGLGGSKTASE